MHLTVQVEHVLPGLLDRIGPRLLDLGSTGPVTLTTTEPLVLEDDNLTSWKLNRHTLASRQPVGLELAGMPGVTVATIEPFTVLAEHSAQS
ncbi:hypothetical protein AB0L75_32335 [Streptomyces sp. NPDC052101]|uniref:hypothetical protein n=1 Tax=Streptomyces sp. NPDC052101 TaxID=3155763 RepID=UPI00341FA94A